MNRLKKYFFITTVSSLLFLVTGISFQAISTYLDDIRYPPNGKLIDIGGYQLHITEGGGAGPTVVLEAGLGLASLDWSLVQSELDPFTRVISYDRAGLGWSQESPYPRTSQVIVEELHTLLKNTNIPGPYILVGHSFGGINILLYALQYPDEVAGLIFVDSCHERQEDLMPPEDSNFFSSLTSWGNPRFGNFFQHLGLSRLVLPFTDVKEELHVFPAPMQDLYLAKISSSKYARAIYGEDILFEESVKQIKASKNTIQDIPVVVITAGDIPDLFDEETEVSDKVWFMLQHDLALKSKKWKHLFAKKSGHMIPWHQPEIIGDAVHEIIQMNQ